MSKTFTCQFCGEVLPSADTYHDIAKCAFTLHNRVIALEAENAALKEAQRWIPVSERLPEGDAVLVYRERGKSNIDIDWTFIEGGREYWYNSGLDNVTHWMPLPEPPEVENVSVL